MVAGLDVDSDEDWGMNGANAGIVDFLKGVQSVELTFRHEQSNSPLVQH